MGRGGATPCRPSGHAPVFFHQCFFLLQLLSYKHVFFFFFCKCSVKHWTRLVVGGEPLARTLSQLELLSQKYWRVIHLLLCFSYHQQCISHPPDIGPSGSWCGLCSMKFGFGVKHEDLTSNVFTVALAKCHTLFKCISIYTCMNLNVLLFIIYFVLCLLDC